MGTGLSVFKGFSNIIVKASIDRDMSLQGFQEHGSKLVSHPYGQQCQSTLHKVCQSCVRLRIMRCIHDLAPAKLSVCFHSF